MRSINIFCIVITGMIAIETPAEQGMNKQIKNTHIQDIAYNPNQVISIQGKPFITTQIIFDPQESIQNIQNGDLTAWHIAITPELSHVVFLKPTMMESNTNLTIITTHRTYYFKLDIMPNIPDESVAYAIRFCYPDQIDYPVSLFKHSSIHASKGNQKNINYSAWGARTLFPTHCYDDGKRTFFKLKSTDHIPAIFVVTQASGQEALVNAYRQDDYMIVNQVAPQWIIRQGRHQVASIFNDTWIHQAKQNKG
ncbi:MAG: TrbG/VirB9 family P-type conjugative transfer protein [Endozoicomonadaceae bacterium]|nr:TrbG/VirB9 family P-type conjugative transfer protein [Endozoicomonadaceae bacterium]